MPPRLPIVGSDNGVWGDILNEFLEVVHDTDGALKSNVVDTAQLVDGAVTNDKVDAAAGIAQSKIANLTTDLADRELTANKGTASGYASLDSNTRVPDSQLGTGTASSSTYLRGDRSWVALPIADVVCEDFTSSGTWNKPTGAVTVRVQCWGGGGGGGGAGATSSTQVSSGSGGQAGGYAESWFAASSLASSEQVTVGTGGSGGVGANIGGSGGTSSFSSGGTLVSAAGGDGGITLTPSAVTFGVGNPTSLGMSLTGDITARGAIGAPCFRLPTNSSAGSGAGGTGGSTVFGGNGGGGANADGISANGTTGSGGGGAGNNTSSSARNGGSGASGRVIVTTFLTS